MESFVEHADSACSSIPDQTQDVLIKDRDVRIAWAHDHRQRLEIGRKSDLPGVHDLAFDLVGYFQRTHIDPTSGGH